MERSEHKFAGRINPKPNAKRLFWFRVNITETL